MGWLMELLKALPIVAVTVLLALIIPSFIGVGPSKATGLAAAVGMAAETLLWVGVLNVALGLILWRVVIAWVR